VPGIGPLNAAALVGVAPYDDDSARRRGKRRIQGGRPKLRRLLFMAALSACRCDPPLAAFYDRPLAVIQIRPTRLNAMLRGSAEWNHAA